MINTGDIFGGKYLLLISILNTIFVLNNIEQLNYTTTGISSIRFTHVKSLHFSRSFRDTTIQNMLPFPCLDKTISDEGRVGERDVGLWKKPRGRNMGRMWGEVGCRKERREEEHLL